MGSQEFENYYSQIYLERWPVLKNALGHSHRVEYSLRDAEVKLSELATHQSGKILSRDLEGQLIHYILDPASVLVARCLPLQNAEKILDMCAAPGGKSLVLFSRMPKQTELVCNEISAPRREALKKVLQNYIPKEQRENRLWIKGLDGAQFGLRQPGQFDAVLLDAPCSGEAHLLENQQELSHWSPKRTQGLSIKQYSLLSSAWSAIKPGGFIMYSTCSVSPIENDGVIQKLLKKKKDQVEILKPELEVQPEWTEHGFQYLPDRSGMGPMYGCLIRKKL